MRANTIRKPKNPPMPSLALVTPPAGPRWRPPEYLAPGTRRWCAAIERTYELEPHHCRLLELLGAAWDRCVEAREILARDGLTFVDRFGAPHAHPATAIERDSRLAVARLLRELQLDVSTEAPRPPGLTGRWR
jgi:phage terminase small subunit